MSGRHSLKVLGSTLHPALERARRIESQYVNAHDAMSADELVADMRRSSLLSANAKTGASFDFAIGATCSPTKTCGAVCYALRRGAPTTWAKSIRKRVRNVAFVRRAPTLVVVEQLERELRARARYFRRKRGVTLDYVRFCGTGDVFPELVAVINTFAERNPTTKAWVVTRRFELAATLIDAPNMFIQLSTDASTLAADLALAHQIVAAHSRAYTSFLRTRVDDDPGDSALVFHEKRTPGLPSSPRDCPADAGRLELGNIRGMGGTACARCRRCFSDRVLAVQRRSRGAGGSPTAAAEGARLVTRTEVMELGARAAEVQR